MNQLKQQLDAANEQYLNSDAPFGITLLTVSGNITSSRTIMFTSHISQFVNLQKPDIPKVYTGYENPIGKYSSHKLEIKTDHEVIDIVKKYSLDESMLDLELYTMFIYDSENDQYDVITKQRFCDLTEKYGFEYDTSILDSKHVGDTIHKDEILYKSMSYDEHMNYRYGKNVRFMYLSNISTIEDGMVCSQSLADSMTSTEINRVKVPVNDNEFLCNLYGTNDDYKGFPDIGDYINNGILCAKRRITNDRILYDLSDKNLKRASSNDALFLSNGRIVDIDIFCNAEEIADNPLNAQILRYYKQQQEYYKRIYDICHDLKSSGKNVSNDINFLYRKSKDIMDKDVKWRDEASVFNNIQIEFVVQNIVGMSRGQKITGRYGNKGVIVKILPDDMMPVTQNGDRVDLILNTTGVINRTNAFQLYEQSITYICDCVQNKMKTMETREEKEDLFFKLIEIFNEDEFISLHAYYNDLSEIDKDRFIDSVTNRSIYIRIPPFWQKMSIYDRVKRAYKTFPWINIKGYDVYITKFGRRKKMIQKQIVGEMYIIKLKQNSDKGFSSRATGSINQKGLPSKNKNAKNNREKFPNTPIREGENETLNLLIGASPKDVKKLHMLYRSSTKGRRVLGEKMLTQLDIVDDILMDHTFRDRNVEIFNAYFKIMGLELEFPPEFSVKYLDTDKYRVNIYDMEFDLTRDGEKIIRRMLNDIEDTTIDEIRVIQENFKNKVKKYLEENPDIGSIIIE